MILLDIVTMIAIRRSITYDGNKQKSMGTTEDAVVYLCS